MGTQAPAPPQDAAATTQPDSIRHEPHPRRAPKPPAHERCPELDWLRTAIVLGIIPYHALILFMAGSATVIAHPIASPLWPLVIGSLDTWGIALIFLLAGASARFALQVRSSRVYLWDRVLRLLPPLVLVELIFAPLRAYFLLLSNPSLASVSLTPIANPERLQNIFTFFAQYWIALFTTGSPIVVRNPLAHLWFVPRLMLVALITLPLFLFLRGRWNGWIDRVAPSRHHLAALLLGAGLLPALTVALLQPGWLHRLTAGTPFVEDWTIFSLDLAMFVFGYLIYSSQRLRNAARAVTTPALVGAAACWIAVLVVRLRGDVPANDYSPPYFLFVFVQIFAIWLLTLGVLGFAMRYLSMAPSWQPYLTTATFPVYVLHLPLLTIIAYYLQVLPVPRYVQIVLFTILTVAGSFALYEYVVRRTPGVRLLFGLRRRTIAGHDKP